MRPIIRNERSAYGIADKAGNGGGEGGGGGGGEFNETRGTVMAAAMFARDIALELLTSKKTYRVTVGILYSILFVWVLLNLGQMTGNIGKIAEPDDFWRHTRKLVKKSASFHGHRCCCDTIPVVGSNVREDGDGERELHPPLFSAPSKPSFQEKKEEEEGGEVRNTQTGKGKLDSYYAVQSPPPHTTTTLAASVVKHSQEEERRKEERGGDANVAINPPEKAAEEGN